MQTINMNYVTEMNLSQPLSQPINFSQVSNNIPSPSFCQYQNPPQSSQSQQKYGSNIRHNMSNPYEYTMNSGDYSFEEYLRESKIKRSRSDNTPAAEYNNFSGNSQQNMYSQDYMSTSQGYSQNSQSYSQNSDKVNTLCRNMNNVMQQEPMASKHVYSEVVSMKYNKIYNSLSENETTDFHIINPVKNVVVYNARTSSMNYKNDVKCIVTPSTPSKVHAYSKYHKEISQERVVPSNNYYNHSVTSNNSVIVTPTHNAHTNVIVTPTTNNAHSNVIVTPTTNNTSTTIEEVVKSPMKAEPERSRYSQEREEQLFIFYINFLKKELYNNIKEMHRKNGDASPSIRGSDSNTNSTMSSPALEGPNNNTAKGNTIFNNNTIANMGALPPINGEGNNNSSQGSYMTSQSDPYCSPPCSPLAGEASNANVRYCIHLVLKNCKIESYIMLPSECTLCHHECHMETVVETVAKIYSNRSCRNANNVCKYCDDHNCCRRCGEFAQTHSSNDDIAIDLETVESFMSKYTSDSSSEDENSPESANDSDIQTLRGTNTTTVTSGDILHHSHSAKISNPQSYSEKPSESSATLTIDQSNSFENETSKYSNKSYTSESGSRKNSISENGSRNNSIKHSRSVNETFLKSYNLYGNETKSSHTLKTPGESIHDDKAKIDIIRGDSRNDPTSKSLELNTKSSNKVTSSYQEAKMTAKNMAKVMENTSEHKSQDTKESKSSDQKDEQKNIQRLHRAEESRRKVKEKIGYERQVLSYLEAHGGEVTSPEDIQELTDIFAKEFSFYGFILRFSMVFAIICSMFSEHSRHVSYTVDSFISISKIVVFVIVKNITPITSCISALILYLRFIETMDFDTAGDRYKIVRHFSELVRDEEFAQCVDKIFGEYLEKVSMEEDGKDNGEKMDVDENDFIHTQFKSKRNINSDLPIFPSSSMNERNRNVVIDSYLLFVMCLIISHKYTIDTCEYNYKNKSWYFIYTFFLKDYKNPNMTMKQFNQYEFYILCVLQYNIHISMEEYNNFDVFVKRNCSSFGKDLSLYITANVLEKLSKAMVNQEYYKKLNSNNYKNYIFNSVINNMETKIKVFFEQVITMVKRNTTEYGRKFLDTSTSSIPTSS